MVSTERSISMFLNIDKLNHKFMYITSIGALFRAVNFCLV